jgi:putative flippase GtrA
MAWEERCISFQRSLPMNSTIRRQLLRFSIIGVSTVFLVDYSIYIISLRWLEPHFAKSLSFCFGTIYSYTLNRIWTFHGHKTSFGEFGKFICVYSVALGINVILNSFLLLIASDLTSMPTTFSFFASTFIAAMFAFLGIKFIVFTRKGL